MRLGRAVDGDLGVVYVMGRPLADMLANVRHESVGTIDRIEIDDLEGRVIGEELAEAVPVLCVHESAVARLELLDRLEIEKLLHQSLGHLVLLFSLTSLDRLVAQPCRPVHRTSRFRDAAAVASTA